MFASELDRLNWLVSQVRERADSAPAISLEDPEELEVLVVCGALVRTGLSYSAGIGAILSYDLADATGPLERSLFELWNDFRYLLGHGDPRKNARKFQIASLLELKRAADKIDMNDEDRDRIGRQLAAAKLANPHEYQVVVKQRERGRYHWSGESRSAVAEAAGDGGRAVYQMLSWEAHAVMTALRDVEFDPPARKIHFRPLTEPDVAREEVAFRTGGILFHLWNEFASRYDLAHVSVDGT